MTRLRWSVTKGISQLPVQYHTELHGTSLQRSANVILFDFSYEALMVENHMACVNVPYVPLELWYVPLEL